MIDQHWASTNETCMTALDRNKVIAVAVPGMERYSSDSGIGRVLHELVSGVDPHVRVVPAQFRASRLPVLRNMPTAVEIGRDVDVVLLPQLTGAQALRNTGKHPSVVIVHDLGLLDCECDRKEIDFVTRQIILAAFRGLKHASRIIAVSEFTRDRLLYHAPGIPAHRVDVVYNGVSPLFLRQAQSQDRAKVAVERMAGRRLGTPLLLYVGTEGLRKNIDLVLRLLQSVKRDYPGARLLKIGSAGGPRRRSETLRRVNELGLDGDVIFLEGLSDAELATAYAAADVFVSGSLYEGFGLPLVEAMAVGTPAVVTTCGAFPEIGGAVAWITAPRLPAFTEAVHQALTYPRDGARLREGKERAVTFSWSKSTRAYVEIFRELTDRSSTKARAGTGG